MFMYISYHFCTDKYVYSFYIILLFFCHIERTKNYDRQYKLYLLTSIYVIQPITHYFFDMKLSHKKSAEVILMTMKKKSGDLNIVQGRKVLNFFSKTNQRYCLPLKFDWRDCCFVFLAH